MRTHIHDNTAPVLNSGHTNILHGIPAVRTAEFISSAVCGYTAVFLDAMFSKHSGKATVSHVVTLGLSVSIKTLRAPDGIS
jgi:hypothetical protein